MYDMPFQFYDNIKFSLIYLPVSHTLSLYWWKTVAATVTVIVGDTGGAQVEMTMDTGGLLDAPPTEAVVIIPLGALLMAVEDQEGRGLIHPMAVQKGSTAVDEGYNLIGLGISYLSNVKTWESYLRTCNDL